MKYRLALRLLVEVYKTGGGWNEKTIDVTVVGLSEARELAEMCRNTHELIKNLDRIARYHTGKIIIGSLHPEVDGYVKEVVGLFRITEEQVEM